MEEMGKDGMLYTQEELRSLLDPLAKSKLVDLLSRLGSQNPWIAEEILGIADSDPVHRKLFVHGLAPHTTKETLNAAFQIHGEIEDVTVICQKGTANCRGYGFITYKHMESAHSALREPSKLIDGRRATYHLACEGRASTTPDLAQRKLYIGGLLPDVTSEMLRNYFERHGQIEQCSVAYDKDTHATRGFGFVTYKTAEAAKKAIDDPQKSLGGNTISVKPADARKGKAVETQLPSAAVVPPMAPGYPQPWIAHLTAAPLGYAPPQTVASYPAQPLLPPAAHNNPQGIPPTRPMGRGGFAYYIREKGRDRSHRKPSWPY